MSLQDRLNKILWNKRYLAIPDDIERPNGLNYIIIRDLTLEDRNLYSFIREREEMAARKSGVPSEGEIMEAARQGGYWSEADDKILKEADDHIAFLEGEFHAKKKFKSRQNIIKLQIEDAKAKKQSVIDKQSILRASSADYYAHEVACFELIRQTVYCLDNTPLIKNDNDLLDFKRNYMPFLFFLIKDIMNEGSPEFSEIREIARSIEWRLVWCLNRENLASLFECPVRDLTIRHRLLIYWSRIYDSAIESAEPPEREIIDDDQAFDQWLANKNLNQKENKDPAMKNISAHQERGQLLDGEYVQYCNCGAKEQNKGKYLGEKIPHASTCFFGTWHTYTPEEKEAVAQRIYGRNSQGIRKLIDNEQDKVLNKGIVEEQHLRGKKTRQLLGMPTKVIPIHRR